MAIMIALLSLALILQLFILINPLSSFSVLVAAYKRKMNVRKIAYTSVLVAFALAVIMALIGPYLFSIFGVTIDSFRIAGGLVLLLLGIDTIRDKKEKKEVGKIDSVISIIATPLLTGPATISFIAIKSYEINQIALLGNIVFAFLLVGIVFVLFSYTLDKINTKIISVTSKILGLFLTAMAIQMIVTGLTNMIQAV